MKKILINSGILLFFTIIVVSPLLIKITPICKNQFGDCSEEITKKIESQKGKRLVSARRGVNKILKSLFSVSDYSIQFKLPNTLEVNVIEKVPVYSLFNPNEGRSALVDTDGVIISVSDNVSALPSVKTTSSIGEPGQKVQDFQIFALKIVQGVNQMYQISTGEIQSDTLLVELKPNIRVIFPLEGDIDVLLGTLRLIYTKIISPEYAGKYSEIDLRFKNPVLR